MVCTTIRNPDRLEQYKIILNNPENDGLSYYAWAKHGNIAIAKLKIDFFIPVMQDLIQKLGMS